VRVSWRVELPLALALPIVSAVICQGAGNAGPSQRGRSSGLPTTLAAEQGYGNLPLAFEPNVGQMDPQVRFKAHSQGMTVFFTDDEAVMVLHKTEKQDGLRRRGREAHSQVQRQMVRMKLAGASRPSQTAGLDKLPGATNYFIGNDPAGWRTDIPNYARIRYRNVYAGVDLVAYGNQRQLEYDLVVAPGADPRQIELAWEGADSLRLNSAGDLVLATRLGDVVQKRPRVYQEIGGRRVEIAARYALGAGGHVQFAMGRYNHGQPLVIDPLTVVYGSFLGTSGWGNAIAVDSTGAAYVTGLTFDDNTEFPVKSPFQSNNNDVNCDGDAFVTKFSPSGGSLAYSTFLGGSCYNEGFGIAVDSNGSAYVVGSTESKDFPVSSAFQSNCGSAYDGVFVTKLAPAGNSLSYSTYLCGDQEEDGYGIAVDSAGSAYVTGNTSSDNFPVHAAYQATLNPGANAFVTKLAPAGNALVYSTYLGGGDDYGTAIAVDSSGSAYVAGYTDATNFPVVTPVQSKYKEDYGNRTGFVTKLSPAGNSLVWSTYLGGSGSDSCGDQVNGIAVDAGDAAFVTGLTCSTNFPLVNAFQSTNKNTGAGTCFVTKFATAGNALIWSTYLGGDPSTTIGVYGAGDVCNGIAVDSAKEAYVTGTTYSADFPLVSPYQASPPTTGSVGFVTKFASTGSALAFSTYLGVNDAELSAIALDSSGAPYVTGVGGEDFPVPHGFQQTSGPSSQVVVAKLQFTGGTATTVVNTSPAGLAFTVDGTTYSSAQTFTWTAGTTHTIGVNSPQTVTGVSGTRYAFASWSDGGLQTHTITASSSSATYSALFTTQYQLTVAESPAAGGTVTENPSSSDSYYNSGTSVQLTAAPSAGYAFAGWSGALSGKTNPQSLSMNQPTSVTATFSVAGSCAITISPVSVNLPATGTSTAEPCPNNSGQPTCGVAPEIPQSFTVTPSASCGAWTATSSNPGFLQITSGAGGTGTGKVYFVRAVNTHTTQQSDTITVASGPASASFTVAEAGSGDSEIYRQVYALYEQLLGRDPDPGGFAFWTGTGGAGLGQMADSFLTSPEAFNSDFAVMAAYQAATGAPPTFVQYASGVSSIRAGTSLASLFNSLLGGGFTMASLYQNLLNRAPGISDSGCTSMTLANCFETIIGYPSSVTPVGAPNNEFQSTGIYHTADHTNALYVQMIYYVTLSRGPDPSGLAFWVGVANTGGPGVAFEGAAGYPTRIQILGPGTPNQGFIGSSEFQGLFAN